MRESTVIRHKGERPSTSPNVEAIQDPTSHAAHQHRTLHQPLHRRAEVSGHGEKLRLPEQGSVPSQDRCEGGLRSPSGAVCGGLGRWGERIKATPVSGVGPQHLLSYDFAYSSSLSISFDLCLLRQL